MFDGDREPELIKQEQKRQQEEPEALKASGADPRWYDPLEADSDCYEINWL
jgi:hypothetical protein